MSEEKWIKKLQELLEERNWNIKDWHRAVGMNQRALEGLYNNKFKGIQEDVLSELYKKTLKSKIDPSLIQFESPIIIAVWSHKGGTGKSSTAVNLSYELSQRGYNVLAIDTDDQADMSGTLFPEYLENPKKSFYEAFLMHDDFMKKGFIAYTKYLNLDIVPGSAKREELERFMAVVDEAQKEEFWFRCLEGIREENYYDIIIIDMDKSVGQVNRSIFNEADFVLSPIDCSMYSIKAVATIISEIDNAKKNNSKLELLGIILNKVDMRKKRKNQQSREVIENLKSGIVFKNFISGDSSIENAQISQEPLGAYDPNSVANVQTVALTDEILNKIKTNLEERVKENG